VEDALQAYVGAFVDELARCGVREVCVCPGSRSTPLALMLRRHPAIRVWMHLDERSAAFFALGMARALRSPVAVVATSGTATVNLAPAVVEASYGRVPLLVLTADRPPELRDVGALQTIDQVRLYGTHVRWFQEMLIPETGEGAVRHARASAARAVATAAGGAAGPVHLNFPFREPLIPAASTFAGSTPARPAVSVVRTPRRAGAPVLEPLAHDLRNLPRGLVVCGPLDDPGFPLAAVRLAGALGYPVLADALSQVRCGPHAGRHVLAGYDVFLRDPAVVEDLAPEVVLRFGATPVSKPLQQYLGRAAGARQIVVDGGEGWVDPSLTATEVIHADPRLFCEDLTAVLPPAPEGRTLDGAAWLERWLRLEARARAVLAEQVLAEPGLTEPRVFLELAELLPEGAALFAGNSMPVRDLDTFFPAGSRPVRRR
jgi:2-succinyl-5-enolpyruvyl-6-hydroxy-3-cyclohexene-1-carboxylate synthase